MRLDRVTPLIVLAGLLGLSCSRAAGPPAPPPVDPLGTFSFETSYQGQPVGGTVSITGEEGNYSGTVIPHGGVAPPMPINSVTVEGQTVTVTAYLEGEVLSFTMVFEGDTFTGSWTVGAEYGTLSGSRM